MKATDLLIKITKLTKKTAIFCKKTSEAVEKNDLSKIVSIMEDIDKVRYKFIMYFEDATFILRSHTSVAYDFRISLSSILIAKHLEDIVVQIKGAISLYLKIKNKQFFKKTLPLFKIINSQMNKLKTAVSKCDPELSEVIVKNSINIHEEYRSQTTDILLSKKIDSADSYFNKLMFIKKLEKIGNYITLICNEIYYIRKATRVVVD